MTIIMDKRNALLMTAISAACLLAAISIIGFSVLAFAQQQEQRPQLQSPSTDPIIINQSSSSSSLPDVFQKVENSVVQITSTKSNPNEVIILNGVPQTGRRTALGSGFVYDNQGHIVTNSHVVSGVKKGDVTFTDGNTSSANVVGKDAYQI